MNPEEISETFRVFYERLYSSECPSNLDGQTKFLNDLNIPKLSEEESKTIDEGITKQEIADAIDLMQSGKAAGLDGIPIDLYKTFQSKLLTPLLEMFQESFRKGLLPTSMRVALIRLKTKYKM